MRIKFTFLLAALALSGVAGTAFTGEAQPGARKAADDANRGGADVPAQPEQGRDREGGQPADDERGPDQREASRPGEAHRKYDPLAGRWNAQVKMWRVADPEPMQGTGISRYEWVLSDPESQRGRFLRQEFRMDLMGLPYQGLGYWGHDNTRGEYTSLWMDTMNTATMVGTGIYNEDERAFTFTGSYHEPGGQEWRIRTVLTIIDDGRHTFEYFRSAPGVAEHKGMEIVYTRARPGAGEEAERERQRRRDGLREDGRPGDRERPGPDDEGRPRPRRQ